MAFLTRFSQPSQSMCTFISTTYLGHRKHKQNVRQLIKQQKLYIYIYIYACTVPSSFSLTYDQESVHSRITRSTRWCSSASSKSAALFFRHRAKPASMAAGVVQDEAYKYCRDSPIGGQCFTVSCKRATPIACSWWMPKARRLPTHEGRRPGEYMRQEQILFRGRISVGREGLDMLGEEHLSYHRQVPDNG